MTSAPVEINVERFLRGTSPWVPDNDSYSQLVMLFSHTRPTIRETARLCDKYWNSDSSETVRFLAKYRNAELKLTLKTAIMHFLQHQNGTEMLQDVFPGTVKYNFFTDYKQFTVRPHTQEEVDKYLTDTLSYVMDKRLWTSEDFIRWVDLVFNVA